MYPQQFQGQAFNPQGVWGAPSFGFGQNLNDVVNAIYRILPLLQTQGSQFGPQAGAFGFPQQFAHPGFGQTPISQWGHFTPQTGPFPGQVGAFGHPQFIPPATSLAEVVNVLSRILPVLQQTGLLSQPVMQGQPFPVGGLPGPIGPQGVLGFPQQHLAPQGISPEIVVAISRILPFLGTQTSPYFQTGLTGFGSTGSQFVQ